MIHRAPMMLEHETDDLTGERLRRAIEIHFDRHAGTPYWLDRAAELGINPLREVQTFDDLAVFGDMTPAMLRQRPLIDYIPRSFHRRLNEFIVCQTGGTTGAAVWSAYSCDEFEQAFIKPFTASAELVGFPRGEPWLYIGPSGPHAIGKAAQRLAANCGAADPYSVDFDPRWAKRLPAGSLAMNRYLEHIIEQAMDIIQSQRIGVLFTTPVVLARLAETMSTAQRDGIRAVHYGGMALSAAQLHRFQTECFRGARHVSGYGNTLFGCCLELDVRAGRTLDYYPHGQRLMFEVVDERGDALPIGATGRVRFTRLDESMLIVRMLERDVAELVMPPSSHAAAGFVLPGVRDPRTSLELAPQQRSGLY